MFRRKLPIISLFLALFAAYFSVIPHWEKLSFATWLGIIFSFIGLGISIGSIIFKKQYFPYNKDK